MSRRSSRPPRAYLLTSAAVFGIYALILVTASRLGASEVEATQLLIDGLLIVLLAALIGPLREAIGALFDRAFFRRQTARRRAIRGLSRRLTALSEPKSLLADASQLIRETLPAAAVATFWRPPAGSPRVWSSTAAGTVEHTVGAEAARIADRVATEPAGMPIDGDLGQFGRGAAAGERLEYALPLRLQGRSAGFLAIGRHPRDAPLSRDDTRLLRTLADQLAIALQNGVAYAELRAMTETLSGKVEEQEKRLLGQNRELRQAYDELREAHGQLVQSEKMASLGQLVAGVAHELNTPVSFIQGGLVNLERNLDGFVRLLRFAVDAEIDDDAARRQRDETCERLDIGRLLETTPALINICVEGGDRIRDTVRELAVYARTDDEAVEVDLSESLSRTLRLLGPRIDQLGVEVCAELSPCQVRGRPGQLAHVWMNLLTNALDAVEGRPDPAVWVSVDRQREHARVSIRDNGAGIPAGDREKVFDTFFTTKPVGKGTGLGLSIARDGVRAQGGEIVLRPGTPDGTAAEVVLPIACE